MYKSPILLLLPLLLLGIPMSAQNISFKAVVSREKLSQNAVPALAIDFTGYIWMGTSGGLFRYDGYATRSYLLYGSDGKPLGEYAIKNLYVMQDGIVWARTERGNICRYSPLADRFVSVTDERDKATTFDFLIETNRGDVYLWNTKGYGALCLHKTESSELEKRRYSPAGSARSVGDKARATVDDPCDFVAEDSTGNVWLGGKNGLTRVTPDGMATAYYTYHYHFTRACVVGGRACFTTEEAVILAYDDASETFSELPSGTDDAMIDIFALSPHEVVVLQSKRGLWVCDLRTGAYHPSELNKEIDSYQNSFWIVADPRGGAWLYNAEGLVWYVDGQSGRIRRFNFARMRYPFGTPVYNRMRMQHVFVDSEGIYWLPVYSYGLFRYDPNSEQMTHYASSLTPSALPTDYIFCLTEDNFGNLWIGSEYVGTIMGSKEHSYIKQFRPDEGRTQGLDNNVRYIYRDSADNLWLCMKNGSLRVYHPDLTLKAIVEGVLNPYTITEDRRHRLWAGTRSSGVYLIDPLTCRVAAHLSSSADDPESLTDNAIFHIITDSQGRIWAAVFEQGGVALLEESGGQLKARTFLTGMGPRSMVRYLCQDSQGRIWAGTTQGVFRFNPDELIRNPEAYVYYGQAEDGQGQLSNTDIKVIYEDTEGSIYIGTAGGGLNLFVEGKDGQPDSFQAFATSDATTEDFVTAILEHGGELWLSNEHGLTRFDKATHESISYRLWATPQANVYNEASALMLPDSTMLFGSLDGMTIFRPQLFHPESRRAQVRITALSIEDVDYDQLPDRDKRPGLGNLQQLELSHNENSFRAEWASMDFSVPQSNRYSFMLRGYDHDWSVPSANHSATFKNLKPGHYELLIRSTNSLGVWNEQTASLKVVVRPPLWLSLPFLVVYALCFVAVALWLVKKRKSQLKPTPEDVDAAAGTPVVQSAETEGKVTDETPSEEANRLFVEKLMAMIETGYTDSSFSVERLVEQTDCGRTAFFQRVKELTGASPGELIRKRRLQRAAELIREGQRNVAQIAYSVGFDDQFYFSKCFKAKYGVTPKAMMKTASNASKAPNEVAISNE